MGAGQAMPCESWHSAVMKDPSLKESYFTTPLALHTASQPVKYHKGTGKYKGSEAQGTFPPPPPILGTPNGKRKAKGRGKLNGHVLVAMTPDKRQICFAYNAQGCAVPNCPRVHCCRVQNCFGDNPASQHHVHASKANAGATQPPATPK